MENKIVKILVIFLILCVIGIIVTCIYVNNESKFVKPEEDAAAVEIPEEIPDEVGYSTVEIKEGYLIGISSKLIIDEANNLKVYFTSNKENDVYVKLRIYNEKNKLVAETGLIKPGKCIEKVKLNSSDDNLKVKVMSYNPKTYYSEGTATFNLKTDNNGGI